MPLPKRFEFNDLPAEEQTELVRVYGPQAKSAAGYSARKIKAIYELSTDEKCFFEGQNFISPHFFVQTLYKLRGEITPLRFHLGLRELARQSEALRTNYCQVGTRTLRIVLEERPLQSDGSIEVLFFNLKNQSPEKIGESLGKYMEADMRREIDIARSPLIRFAVFHTAADEYAVHVTISQLIANYFDITQFFRFVMGKDASLPPASLQKPATLTDRSRPVKGPAREYWEKVLAEAPSLPPLPYSRDSHDDYQQQSYRLAFPAALTDSVLDKARGERKMLMAILQTAWSFMLQGINQTPTAAFCLLPPKNAADAFNLLPVLSRYSNDKLVQQIALRQLQNMMSAPLYDLCDGNPLRQLNGRPETVFDHFLSFYDFLVEDGIYAKAKASPQGQVVAQNSWDARGMKLGVYFHYRAQSLSATFLYDEKRFQPGGVAQLARLYQETMLQAMTDWDKTFSFFRNRLADRLKGETLHQPVSKADDTERRQQISVRLPLLRDCPENTAHLFNRALRQWTLFEGDLISRTIMEKHALFVAEGHLARSLDAGDGWYNPLDIIKPGGWVNETILLPERKVSLVAEVLSEKALLLTIPLEPLQNLLQTSPELARNIIWHALAQMEKYQRLWSQS